MKVWLREVELAVTRRAQQRAVAGDFDGFLFGFEIENHVGSRVGGDGDRTRFGSKTGRGDRHIEGAVFQQIGRRFARGSIGRQHGIGARARRIFQCDRGVGNRFCCVHVFDDDVQTAHDIGASGQGGDENNRGARDERKHSIFGFHEGN